MTSLVGHVEVSRILLEYGANTEHQDKDGSTPLMIASLYDRLGVAKLLLEKGARKEHQNKNGETPLDVARRLCHHKIIDLLEHGCLTPMTSSLPEPAPYVQPKASSLAKSIPYVDKPIVREDDPLNFNQDIADSRNALKVVIKDVRAVPAQLSQRYIEECTKNFTSNQLGGGAFGTVYLGTDTTLGVKFAVKRVPLSVSNQNDWDQITLSFKREIAVSPFRTHYLYF